MESRQQETTTLLTRLASGDTRAQDELFAILYDELRAIAGRQMAGGRHRHTLQPTAIVHEAYLKLRGEDDMEQGRFIALAVKAIRQVLVDYARKKSAMKRGGDQERLPLVESAVMGKTRAPDILEVDELLNRFELHDDRAATIVELKFFGEMTNEQVAVVMGISEKTVRNEWRHAKAWLRAELQGNGD